MKNLTPNIQECFSKLRETTSNKEKIAILKGYEKDQLLQLLLYYTYSTDKYGVSSKNCQKILSTYTNTQYNSIFELLDDLRSRKLTGNEALMQVATFVKLYDADFLYKVIDHDLDLGITKTTIKKVWPTLFENWGVALCEKYNDKTQKLVDYKGNWLISRKLDGVRLICIKEGENIRFFARSGKEFKTLDVLKREISKIPGDFVLDGECCIVDENGDEDFTSIVSEIKRKDWTIENPCYQVFDCLTKEEFDNHFGATIYKERYIREPMKMIRDGVSSNLKRVEQTELISMQQLDETFDKSLELGWEGLVLRKNVGYEGKRSKNMLKMKKFQDAEFEILGCENDNMKFIVGGKQIDQEVLANIIIEYKGNKVSVGSGLSKAERVYYKNHHDELIGKQVTIKYFQESKNADGTYSLRFPVVKHIYDEKRDC